MISPGSIPDRTHIAILLTQLADPDAYSMVMDFIQSRKDLEITLISVGNSLVNFARISDKASTEQGVDPVKKSGKSRHCNRKGHYASECWEKYPQFRPKKKTKTSLEETRKQGSSEPTKGVIENTDSQDRAEPCQGALPFQKSQELILCTTSVLGG